MKPEAEPGLGAHACSSNTWRLAQEYCKFRACYTVYTVRPCLERKGGREGKREGGNLGVGVGWGETTFTGKGTTGTDYPSRVSGLGLKDQRILVRQRKTLDGRETAQLVNALAMQARGPGFGSLAYYPSTGGQRRVDLGNPQPASLAEPASFQFSEKLHLQ